MGASLGSCDLTRDARHTTVLRIFWGSARGNSYTCLLNFTPRDTIAMPPQRVWPPSVYAPPGSTYLPDPSSIPVQNFQFMPQVDATGASGQELKPMPRVFPDAQPSMWNPVELASEMNATHVPQDEAPKRARKIGKTCGECRRQHLGCDFSVQEEQAHARGDASKIQCSRCAERGLECVQVGVSLSRYYPRPSRTGKRIELGRQLHGSAVYPDTPSESDNQPSPQLPSRILIRLLRSFYYYMHTHYPIIEYGRFVWALNSSKGNVEVMARMLDGRLGDEATRSKFLSNMLGPRHDAKPGEVSTPGTCETLLCMLCACGIQQVSLPFEQLGTDVFARMSVNSLVPDLIADPSIGVPSEPPVETVHTEGDGPRKRQKRRQGVACDTCRLRRVRCDLMEQPPGVKACSRCRVKRVACTDRYIQWKRQRDIQRQQASRASESGALEVPNALKHVNVFPVLEDFHLESFTPEDVVSASQLEMIEHGRAREEACNILLNRVLLLVHKHDLLHTRNLQSVQTLLLLSCVLDYQRRELSLESQRVACLHANALGMDVMFDLTDMDTPHGAERLLMEVQYARVNITLWVREAFLCLSSKSNAALGRKWIRVVERRDGKLYDLEVDHILAVYNKTKDSRVAAFLYYMTSTFLGRACYELIDELITPIESQGLMPTAENVERVGKVCKHLWDTISVTEDIHFTTMRDGKDLIYSLKPFIMPMWSYLMVILMALLNMNIMKRLREWHAMHCSVLAGAQMAESKHVLALRELRVLIATSQQRALVSCRRTAWAIRTVLPSGMLLRSTTATRQLFNVSQYLTRTPPVEVGGEVLPHDRFCKASTKTQSRNSSLSSLLNSPGGDDAQTPKEEQQEQCTESVMMDSYDEMSNMPDEAGMGPYTVDAKRVEVGWCIEALGQMGYSFTGIDTEIQRLVDLFKAVE